VGNQADSLERTLIETLTFGNPEYFFAEQSQGIPTRFLGSQFRLNDGTRSNDTGPFYDLYQTIEPGAGSGGGQARTYWFNSATLLLERITFRTKDSRLPIEIRISGWHAADGQQVPGKIVRLESNEVVATFTIGSSNVTARVEDHMFSP
jgi:hypothetical protein